MDRDNASTATQADNGMTRRGVMRKTAIGIGATATIGGGAMTLENGPVQGTEAFVVSSSAVAVGVAALAGGAVGAGWLLRDQEIIGKDDPAEGLTGEALKQQIAQTTKTRASVNKSTIVDNKNIVQAIEQPVYTKGKTAAIEAINNGKSETEVVAAANDAVNKYTTSIQKNLLNSWNESVNELSSLVSSVESHPDLSLSDTTKDRPIQWAFIDDNTQLPELNDSNISPASIQGGLIVSNTQETLFDGTTKDVRKFETNNNGYTVDMINGASGSSTTDSFAIYIKPTDTLYLVGAKWKNTYDKLKNVVSGTKSNLQTWVQNTYASVKSNDISIGELTTPAQRANALPDGEDMAKAIADLYALNIPIDSKRKATVTINSTGAELSGNLGLTDSTDGPLQSGTSYDPSTFSGVALLTTDLTKISGTWQNGNDSATLSSGVLEITSKPPEGIALTFELGSGTTIRTTFADWTYDANASGNYTFDVSSEVSNPDGSISKITFGVDASEPDIKTIQLSKPFTINSIVNEETGESKSESEFSKSQTHTDSNYITQDEWNTLEQQNKELIEKYEGSQTTSGGGGGFLSDGGGDVKTLGIVAGGAALAALLFGNN